MGLRNPFQMAMNMAYLSYRGYNNYLHVLGWFSKHGAMVTIIPKVHWGPQGSC